MTKVQTSLRRLVVESLFITASILLAFALDAWWDRRGDRLDERELLIALQSEFDDVRRELERAQAVHVVREAANSELLKVTADGSTLPAPDSLWKLLTAAHRGTTINLASGVLGSAIDAGTIALVRDANLRTKLAAWPSRVEDHAMTESGLRGYLLGVLRPWWAEHALYPEDSGPSTRWQTVVAGPIRSAVYRNHVHHIRNMTQTIVSENEQLLIEVTGLKQRLAELTR
jgi:hypothetical protein